MVCTDVAGLAAPAIGYRRRRRLAVLVDPRFAGGTSHAVAQDLRLLADAFELEVHGFESAMFRKREIAPPLAQALADLGLDLIWDSRQIFADIVVLHNPSALRFDTVFSKRILCHRFIAVAHENHIHPMGHQTFDVGQVYAMLDRAVTAPVRQIAPVSHNNRETIRQTWHQLGPRWSLTSFDWTNIVAGDCTEPVSRPRDRRGRHSRPGPEKFPPLPDLQSQFPQHAEKTALMGADRYLSEPSLRHCDLLRFGTVPVRTFLERIDFFVYFTHPSWNESFGRSIADAVQAGKLVMTDPRTAETFGAGVVGMSPDAVDGAIAAFISEPDRYARHVRAAQAALSRFSADAFHRQVIANLCDTADLAGAVL